MKLKTIERNIKYTDKPYPDIYRKAELKGLRVVWDVRSDVTYVTAYNKNNHFAHTCYYNNDITKAAYNEYSY